MNDIKEKVRAKFKEQKDDTAVKTVCPHCNEPIIFKFDHTQTTEVKTTLLEIGRKAS